MRGIYQLGKLYQLKQPYSRMQIMLVPTTMLERMVIFMAAHQRIQKRTTRTIKRGRELAENELKKHFDADAFLILAEIAKLDAVPDSDINEHIDTSKDMFAEYMWSRSAQDLAAYMAQVHQIISELYHTVESVEEREIIKNELAKMAQIC